MSSLFLLRFCHGRKLCHEITELNDFCLSIHRYFDYFLFQHLLTICFHCCYILPIIYMYSHLRIFGDGSRRPESARVQSTSTRLHLLSLCGHRSAVRKLDLRGTITNPRQGIINQKRLIKIYLHAPKLA